MAKHFGKTWWGEQFLQSLANIDYSNRLPRGSAYARNGSVKSIAINENQISAKVSGSRPTPYKIEIIIPPFFEADIKKLIKALAEKPMVISKLLNRELDPEVLQIAERCGLKVFPKQWKDFKMHCSCPDSAVPCKHLAAVIYKVSAEIDNNPFLAFSLHRVELVAELKKENIHIDGQANKVVPTLQQLLLPETVSKKKPKHKTKVAAENTAQPQLPALNYATLSPIYEALVQLLSDAPVFYQGNGNFREKYAASIRKAVRNAQRVITAKVALLDYFPESKQSLEFNTINHHSQISAIKINGNNQANIVIDNGADIKLATIAHQLWQIPHAHIGDYQPSVIALKNSLLLAINLLANGALVPQIFLLDNKDYAIRWLPAMLSKEVKLLVEKLDVQLSESILLFEGKPSVAIEENKAENLLSVWLSDMVVKLADGKNDDVFCDLFFANQRHAFNAPAQQALPAGIQQWLQRYYFSQGKYKPSIVVEELRDELFQVSINIKETAKPLDKPIALRDVLTLKKHEAQRFEILGSLAQLSSFFPKLDAHINSQAEELITMDAQAFTPFLLQAIPAIQLLDIDILLPKSLQDILRPKASVKLKGKGKDGQSYLRLDEMLSFDWQVAIGDTVMDEAEFKRLLKNSDGLIKYKTQYIYVDKADLEKLHKHFNASKNLSAFEMLRAALSNDYFGAKISMTDDVQALIKELTQITEVPLPKGINAVLRPYQHRGFSWMYKNTQIGFGSVLADDMGLGKTLQVITMLLKYKEEGMLKDAKALVIAPTGLLTNWQAEMEKFAPSLVFKVHHGTARAFDKKEDFDVMLTSYGIARGDADKLKKLKWQVVITDEAQNIKNFETAQSKAVKSIPANTFIAMSGTPVENRLSEMWSIMDFCNRGFLGNIKDFKDNFATPIQNQNDAAAAEKLKLVTSPFMMRRLKSDRSIISDLPDKIEMDCFGTLAKQQASLYQKTLQKALEEIEGVTKGDAKSLFVRQGLVLQMILALKQICNHPTQFLKNNILDASLSGKMELLFDRLDSIVEAGEKVLIFTQFTEMGNLLKHFIAERFGETPLFYHGGCSIQQRKEMVDGFQTNRADKIFILSLKAAGTGLNLTAANHVIHYDLWWNPAVEAQATDRAYRIGQKSNVMVHRFITKGTFEEKINEMIQGKKALADMTVATGETWIGNMGNKALKEMFELG